MHTDARRGTIREHCYHGIACGISCSVLPSRRHSACRPCYKGRLVIRWFHSAHRGTNIATSSLEGVPPSGKGPWLYALTIPSSREPIRCTTAFGLAAVVPPFLHKKFFKSALSSSASAGSRFSFVSAHAAKFSLSFPDASLSLLQNADKLFARVKVALHFRALSIGRSLLQMD